jgi:hypothetical protein
MKDGAAIVVGGGGSGTIHDWSVRVVGGGRCTATVVVVVGGAAATGRTAWTDVGGAVSRGGVVVGAE